MLHPSEEARRVEALRAFGVLDTPREPDLDSLTALLAALCGTPIAFVSLVDERRQWFKSVHGADWKETEREVAFCAHAIEQRETFVIEDAALDTRFIDNPLVCGVEGLRFYAGVPLVTTDGHALGALAVVDRVPRRLQPLQLQALQALAAQVLGHLESGRRQRRLEDALLQRDRSRAALRDSEARWRMLFERNPLPIWVYDIETLRFLAVNDAAMVHYGWSAAEFKAMTVADIRPPDEVPALMQDLSEGRQGLGATRTWRHRRKNGDLLWVDITAHSIELGGRPGRLILAHDVTDRVRALEAVRDSQARWESLFAASAIGIVSARGDGVIVSANPSFCTLVGRSEAEVVGQHVLAFTHADDVEPCSRGLAQLAAGETASLPIEKRYLRPDGRPVWARAAVTLTDAVPGQPGGGERHFVAVVQDVDAQRAAEDALQRNGALIGAAGRIARVGGWAVDLPDAGVRWSDELRLILDVPTGQQPNVEEALSWYTEESRPRIEQALQACLQHGTPFDLELQMVMPQGRQLWVRAIGQPMRDGAGRIIGASGALLDQTAHKVAQAALRATEAQLQQAQRLEVVGQLTGGIAHDFNNLLTVILGNAELLSEQLQDRPALQSLAQMSRTAAERGAALTQRLLAFARKQALQPQPVDTHQLLAGMDALLRRTLPEHIELEMVRGAGTWPAMADPAQLESALLNLVLNARDAMPEGGKLTLETANAWIDQAYADQHADVLPGQYVLLSVSDTGAGMTAAQLARAFEPFYTTKGVGKGSGLGLSMVYGFAKQSRGHVKLYSEVGQGTTVRLYLPRAAADSLAAGAGSLHPPVSHVEPALRGTATVLVVEDDDLVRRHAADALAALGYTAVLAEHGAAALTVLRARADIDLLFTDVVMPGGMNGRQLAEAALALRPGLKVLYTSGYTENAIVHHGRLDRGVHLLPKPYRSVDLARKLRVVLEGQAG